MEPRKAQRLVDDMLEQIPQGGDCANVPRWVSRALVGAGLTATLLGGGCTLFSGPRAVYAGPPAENHPQRKDPPRTDPMTAPTPDQPPAEEKKQRPIRPPEARPLYGITPTDR